MILWRRENTGGYLSFLDQTCSDILNNYNPKDGFVAAGRCFLTLTMMVAIPANLNPTVKSGVQLKDYFSSAEPLISRATSTPRISSDRACFRITVSVLCLACQAALAVVVPNVGTVLSLLGATVATAMMLIIPAYCMGVVMEKTVKRQLQQALLYFCSLLSVASVPITFLELANLMGKPPVCNRHI
ncbi:unnamed protein product [Effrenium voratum]|nr:unnamed protein product [Effrenium voratum]